MAETPEPFKKPLSVATVPVVAGSAYEAVANKSHGDSILIDTAVSDYLRQQSITSQEDFNARANALREQYAEPSALQGLKNRSFTGQKFHSHTGR